jgi:hypothetical protein
VLASARTRAWERKNAVRAGVDQIDTQIDMELRMDTRRLPRSRHPRSLLLAIFTAMLLAVGAGSAHAASNLEGVWSFGGGEIAIQPLSNGTFVGTVVTETKFAQCTHPVGQQIWAGMTLQADGSFWGLHQWYYETASCALNPTLGPTAWRVLQASDGSRFLRVCFSTPGSSQPTIAANGDPSNPSEYAAFHVTYGCDDSALEAPLPTGGSGSSGSGGFGKAVILPVTSCVEQGSLKIELRDPKFDPLKAVTIRVKGKLVASVHGAKRLKRGIVLRGLPSGTYTLKIVATTVLGHKLAGSRTYRACAAKPPSGQAPASQISLMHRRA